MAKKNDRGVVDAEQNMDSVETSVREMLPRIDMKPIMDRAQVMLQQNPAQTLAVAVGAGFVLGVTLFSKVGRIALAGMLGLGAEVALQKIRMNYLEHEATA